MAGERYQAIWHRGQDAHFNMREDHIIVDKKANSPEAAIQIAKKMMATHDKILGVFLESEVDQQVEQIKNRLKLPVNRWDK